MNRKKNNTYINRELSWLRFNDRVLQLSQDTDIPVLERLKFLAISASNLDEFFMVRVGGLTILSSAEKKKFDLCGLTPLQQLTQIHEIVKKMVARQQTILYQSILPELSKSNIKIVKPSELSDTELKHGMFLFESEYYPLLTPISLDNERPMPLLANKVIHFLIRKKATQSTENSEYILIALPWKLNRMIFLPSHTGTSILFLEDLLSFFMQRIIGSDEYLEEVILFRITRNADVDVVEDLASDLLPAMMGVLDARKRSDCIRLEIAQKISKEALSFLKTQFTVSSRSIYLIQGILDLSVFMSFSTSSLNEQLKNVQWPAQIPIEIESATSLFSLISKKDLLLYHPYESFDVIVRFINEASLDPDVLAIKQTLYRTSKNSPIISALKRAASQGKMVTVLVELKARFDEEQNIEWAKQLEDCGVQVIYGIKRLKTHAKITIVIRREPQGIKKYLHFGTGNYNEKTATLYTDISYLTAHEDLGADASAFFNIITGYSRPQSYRKIEAAPLGLRKRLLSLIEQEIYHKKEGRGGHIIAKVNSLTDKSIIDALYEASCAGVRIDLLVRGICCLKPAVPGLSETITVKSIVDRFLEHSRIVYFNHGGTPQVFISSADWMQRNFDQRIELFVPVLEDHDKQRLFDILTIHLNDTRNAWQLQSNSEYVRCRTLQQAEQLRSQQYLYEQTVALVKQMHKDQPLEFHPYRNGENAI